MPRPLEIVPAETAAILDAVEAALNAEDGAKSAVQHLIITKVKAGVALSKKREELAHGEWLPWVEANMPITDQTARKWIKLAHFAQTHGADLENAQSVRQAYLLAGLLPEPESDGGKQSNHREDLFSQLSRVINSVVARRPVENLNAAEKDQLKVLLRPFLSLFAEQ